MQLKHTDIWRAIDRLAEQNGLSASGLAKKAGLSPTVFNPSKRALGPRKRWPSTESIAHILKATRTGLDEFVALVSPDGAVVRDTLPLLDTGRAQKENAFDDDGNPVLKNREDMRFPALKDPLAFALEITGKSFEPLYREGDRIILSPAAEARRGDRVVMRTREGKLLIGMLGRENTRHVELIAPGASAAISLPLRDIEWMYRIVWVSQ